MSTQRKSATQSERDPDMAGAEAAMHRAAAGRPRPPPVRDPIPLGRAPVVGGHSRLPFPNTRRPAPVLLVIGPA